MECGRQPRHRRQASWEHRSGPPLSHMVAGGDTRLNRVEGAAHRLAWAHFDNCQDQSGMDLFVYCDMGFEFCFSPPIWSVEDPWGRMAKWVAVKGFPEHPNRLRKSQYHTRHRFTRLASVQNDSMICAAILLAATISFVPVFRKISRGMPSTDGGRNAGASRYGRVEATAGKLPRCAPNRYE